MSTIDPRMVSGEASESDTDDELTAAAELIARHNRPVSVGEELRQAGVVVQGEASETESEEDEEENRARAEQQQHFPSQANIPPLKVDRTSRSPSIGSQSSIQSSTSSKLHPLVSPLDPPKYDTLLHRKLRERNISLQASVHEAVSQAIQTKHRELSNTNQMITKSQMVIQDVCYSMRHFSDDLKRVNDKLDIISTSGYLPEFAFPMNGS